MRHELPLFYLKAAPVSTTDLSLIKQPVSHLSLNEMIIYLIRGQQDDQHRLTLRILKG
jgi:hypothetical protein